MIAAAAAVISVYLTLAHYSGTELVCTQGALIDCSAVTSSSYSLVPGTAIPVSLAGLAWSAASAALALAQRPGEPRWLRPAHLAWAVAGMLVVLYLVDAEIRVIGRICEWCTALHGLVAATFFVALRRAVAATE